jgi:hypothetical protein
MKCRRHSSYGMKLFIPLNECLLHFIINNAIINRFWDSVGWIRNFAKNCGSLRNFGSRYVALLFNMIRINCTPHKCSGFNQMEEAKVSFRDVWLDTLCRIHSWCQQKADPVKGLKMSSMWPTKVTCLRKF